MSKSAYIDKILNFLNSNYGQFSGSPEYLWNQSTNNSFDQDWLLATPTNVWNMEYTDFKQEVSGTATDYKLQPCTVDAQGGQCIALESTRKQPSDVAQKLLVGHSYKIYEEIYKLIISADKFLDITTLTIPRDQFMIAVRNAITYLSNKPTNTRPIIRILYSNPLPDGAADGPVPNEPAMDFLKDITRDVNPNNSLEIYIGILRSSFTSWNHSKIIAADGVRAITGGHNLWASNYCMSDPVFDVSMKLSGTAALHAHDYANGLWHYLISFDSMSEKQWIPNTYSYYKSYYNAARIYNSSTRKNDFLNPKLPTDDIYTKIRSSLGGSSSGSTRVIAIGRQAAMTLGMSYNNMKGCTLPGLTYYTRGTALIPPVTNDADQNLVTDEPSNSAMLKAFSLATNTIRMSLQALCFSIRLTTLEWFGYTAGPYDSAILTHLAAAMKRGVKVYITLSNRNAIPGGQKWTEALYDGNTPSEINWKFEQILVQRFSMSEKDAQVLIKTNLFATSIRYNANEAKYPDGYSIGNHAKTFLIDDRLFYIGSQNLYSSNLNEFGFLVEDQTIAGQYKDAYWTKLWQASQNTLVISPSTSDSDNQDYETIEGIYFYIELFQNGRLKDQFEYAKQQRNNNAPADSAPQSEKDAYDLGTKILLDDIITNAGFYTTIESVISASTNPIFHDGTTTTNKASDKFVVDITTNKDLYKNFVTAMDAQTGKSPAEANTNINKFLSDNGYDCTAAQVHSSFQNFRSLVLAYWSGDYSEIWIIADGGKMFDYEDKKNTLLSFKSQTTKQVPLPTDPNTLAYKGDSLSIDKDGNVSFAGKAIKNPTFVNSILTWSTSDGNDNSAKISFNEISRTSLGNDFIGYECCGYVTYSSTGTAPRRGKVSYYARLPIQGSDPKSVPYTPVILRIIGSPLVLIGIIFAIKKISDVIKQKAAAEAYCRLKKYDELTEDDLVEIKLINSDVVGKSIQQAVDRQVHQIEEMIIKQQRSLLQLSEIRNTQEVESIATKINDLYENLKNIDNFPVSQDKFNELKNLSVDVKKINTQLIDTAVDFQQEGFKGPNGEQITNEQIEKFRESNTEYNESAEDVNENPFEEEIFW